MFFGEVLFTLRQPSGPPMQQDREVMGIVSLDHQTSSLDRWTRAADTPALEDTDALSLGQVLETIRRNLGLILGLTALFLIGALLVNGILPKTYESTTRVLIDPRGLQVVDRNVVPGPSDNELNMTLLESEMGIIESDPVLSRVIKELKLTEDPEFNGTETGPLSFISNFIGAIKSIFSSNDGDAANSDSQELVTLKNLRDAIEVDRKSKSFVVDVMARSREPEKAQRIADTLAAQYIQDRVQSRFGTTDKASKALTARLEELRQRLEQSESAVERYKKDNDIVGASGQLVNEQQLAELNTQLGAARTETARARAILDQVQRLRRSGGGAEAAIEALQSPTILALKTRITDIRQREAALSVSLMPSHPRMREIRNERRLAQNQLNRELTQVARSARLNLERTVANERTLANGLRRLKAITSNTNEKSVKLRELERKAEANRSVYNAFLTRSRELSEQKTVDTSIAEIISPAVPSRTPTRSLTIMAMLATLAGLGAGLGLAFVREAVDPNLRTPNQIKSLAGLKRVTTVPKLTDSILPRNGIFGRLRQNIVIRQQANSQLPAFFQTTPDAPASKAIAELATDINAELAGDPNPSVLFTAVDHNAAKSTVALNVALAAAGEDRRVLLIDADFDRKNITKKVGAEKAPGLLNIMDGNARIAATILKDTPFPTISILPAGTRTGIIGDEQDHPGSVQQRILHMTRNFDLVIIDSGLLRNARRFEAWGNAANAFYVVVREGLTMKDELQTTLKALPRPLQKSFQAVFVTDS